MKKAVLIGAACLLFAGCGMSYDVSENTIFVKKNGEVAETNVMSITGLGSTEELEAFIDEEIAAYDGPGTVKKDRFSVDGDNVTLTVTYSDGETYSDFVKHPFYTGSVVKAMAAGYPFTRTFYEAEEKKDDTEVSTGNVVTKEVVTEDPNLRVVILSIDTNVEVGGKILYYSDNVELTGKSTAIVTGYEEEGLSKEPAYIIFQ